MAKKDTAPELDPSFDVEQMAANVAAQAEIQDAAQDLAAATAKRVKVKFFNGAGEDGRDDVLLGLNGTVLRVKREQVVEIPEPYLHVADCAVQTVYDSVSGEARDVPRFPYQRM